MSTETRATWTCDRCGNEWVTTDVTQQPPTPWGSLRLRFPPNGSEAGCRWDICPDCESALARWLNEEGDGDE